MPKPNNARIGHRTRKAKIDSTQQLAFAVAPSGKPIRDPADAAHRYAHGTRARYALGKCRCFQCKVANATYEQARVAERQLVWRVQTIGEGTPGRRGWRVQGYRVQNNFTGDIHLQTTNKAEALRIRNTLNAEEGIPELLRQRVPIGTALPRHLHKLLALGITRREMCKKAGVNRAAVWQILSARTRRISRDLHQRLYALTPSDFGIVVTQPQSEEHD